MIESERVTQRKLTLLTESIACFPLDAHMVLELEPRTLVPIAAVAFKILSENGAQSNAPHTPPDRATPKARGGLPRSQELRS